MSQKNIPEISTKNTKNEILEAYNSVLEQLQKNPTNDLVKEKRTMEQKSIIENATQISSESVVSDLASLKISLAKLIDNLSEKLTAEVEKFKNIQKAIQLEQTHLCELYAIKETTQTLAALIIAQKKRSEDFEIEIRQKRDLFEQTVQKEKDSWRTSREQIVADYETEKATLAKQRVREKEEYHYRIDLERRKDEDEYQDTKNKLEKELDQKREDFEKREILIKTRESELAELRLKVESFPLENAKSIEKAQTELQKELQQKHEFALKLKDSEINGSFKLYDQKVKSLEEKINEQDAIIKSLTKRTDESAEQVQFIACKALDASSQRFADACSFERDTTKRLKENISKQ
jgi:hypothetical protein